MRATSFALVFGIGLALARAAQAAPLSPQEVRQVLGPSLDVCMEIPLGAYRIGQDNRQLDALVTGLRDRGLVTITNLGEGNSIASGANDLDRLEEQHVFSPLVDVALADGIDRSALCAMTRQRVGVPLGPQRVRDVTKMEPAGDGGLEAQVLVEGTIDRVLSKYATLFDPALTPKGTFRAELVYDITTKAWLVRRLTTRNVGEPAK